MGSRLNDKFYIYTDEQSASREDQETATGGSVSKQKMRERSHYQCPHESRVKFKKKKKEPVSSRKTTNGRDNQSLEGAILRLRRRNLLLEKGPIER